MRHELVLRAMWWLLGMQCTILYREKSLLQTSIVGVTIALIILGHY